MVIGRHMQNIRPGYRRGAPSDKIIAIDLIEEMHSEVSKLHEQPYALSPPYQIVRFIGGL